MRTYSNTAWWIIVAGVTLVAFWFGYGATERYYLQQLTAQNQSTLRLVSSGLQGSLLRYEPLTSLLADKADVKLLLSSPQDQDRITRVSEQLRSIAQDIDASDIYVMNSLGVTIAASNHEERTSFIGRNFNFRPYFQEAVQGASARYFALGTTSLKRGYYFASPVRSGEKVTGVIVIKIGVEEIENDWRGSGTEVIVADTDGIIFMASREEWLFKSLNPLSDTALTRIRTSKRYPIEKLSELQSEVTTSDVAGSAFTTITLADSSEAYLTNSRFMSDAGWTVHAMVPKTLADGRTLTALVVATLVVLLLLLIMTFVLQRRARLVRDIVAGARAQEQLELRVAERTNDLNIANENLTKEVAERRQAEQQLLSTQNELVQAGKLAVLGQMSAALSHELNQPLAAIKSYAENARTYLARNKAEQASQNIGHISEMADRMAELGSHLRNFARKPKQATEAIGFGTVIEGVKNIIGPRLKNENVTLDHSGFDDSLVVNAGRYRLQQVLLNLINNAVDAMSEMDNPVVTVFSEVRGHEIALCVRDHGPGLNETVSGQLFDPFFTTKGVNQGLGLGLSISYNIIQDFGGAITAENHPDGGAVFTVLLKQADQVEDAAE